MKYNHVITDENQHTLIIKINRPEKLNALNFDLIKELNVAIGNALADDNTHALIITGSGDKSFVAGADINEIAQLDQISGEEVAKNGQKLMDTIEKASKPIIACVNGYALGGGCELAMACHIRIASENAIFGQPEINLGIIPGYGGTQRLTQLIGKARALELMLTADTINAEQALQFGLVNHVVAKEKLLEKALEITRKVSMKPALATAQIIKSVNAGYQTKGYDVEAQSFGDCIASGDFKEGAQAFLEKRKPTFR